MITTRGLNGSEKKIMYCSLETTGFMKRLRPNRNNTMMTTIT